MRTKRIIQINEFSATVENALNGFRGELLDALSKTQAEDGVKGKKMAKSEYIANAIDPYRIMKTKTRKGKPRKAYVTQFYTNKIGFLTQKISNKDYRLTHLLNDGHKSANQYGKNYTVKKSKKGYKGLPRKKTVKLIYWTDTTKYLEKVYPQDIENTIKEHLYLNL